MRDHPPYLPSPSAESYFLISGVLTWAHCPREPISRAWLKKDALSRECREVTLPPGIPSVDRAWSVGPQLRPRSCRRHKTFELACRERRAGKEARHPPDSRAAWQSRWGQPAEADRSFRAKPGALSSVGLRRKPAVRATSD